MWRYFEASQENFPHGFRTATGELARFATDPSLILDKGKALRLTAKDFADFPRKFEIQITDALHAVSVQINDHLVPHIAPVRVVVHGFGHERDSRHVAERGHKVFTLERAVQFASS